MWTESIKQNRPEPNQSAFLQGDNGYISMKVFGKNEAIFLNSHNSKPLELWQFLRDEIMCCQYFFILMFKFGTVPRVMETLIWTSSNIAAVASSRQKQAQITAVQPLGSLWPLLPGSNAGGKEEPDWSACIWQTKVFSTSSFPDGHVEEFHLLLVKFKKMNTSPGVVRSSSSECNNNSTSLLNQKQIKAETLKKLIRLDEFPDRFQHLRLILLFS